MKATLLAVWLLGSPVAAQAAWEANLVGFPSAEEDRDRDGQPDGWVAQRAKSPADLAWDRTVARTGSASLRIRDSANPAGKEWSDYTGRWVSAPRREVVAGQTYTLGAWIRTEGVTGSASACIAWWAGSKWLAESPTKRLSGTSDWQHVTVSAAAPAGATEAQVYLGLGQSRGAAWFDDIVLVRGAGLPGDYRPVDLAASCTAGLADEVAGDGKGGWTDEGPNDLRMLPTGEVWLRGVPFRIVPPGAGPACVVLKRHGRVDLPEAVTIPVGRTCGAIYFLHAAAGAREGAQVGTYELLYEDAPPVAVPIVAGKEASDWRRAKDTPKSALGWEGRGADGAPVGLSLLPMANPRPDRALKAVRFASGGATEPAILVALTTADGPPALADLPVTYVWTDTSGWYPWTFPAGDTNLDTIDLTRFLDAPAGKRGFLTVRPDGRFYFEDGTRARFFGTNLAGPSVFVEKTVAPALAARLAKYGVNLLRIHAVDSRWGASTIDYARGDSRHLSAEMMDRLDFLVCELKKRGIYVYLDLLDYRRFQDADGVMDASKFEHGWTNSIKGATVFDDRLIELQKEYAELLLTHRNPYTHLRYVDDPAVAVVEITNENSVFYFHNAALTLPAYVEQLKARWNAYLRDRYGDRAALAKAWTDAGGTCALLADEDPARGTVLLPMRWLYQDPAKAARTGEQAPLRVDAMVRFFFELERRYYGQMHEHLRKIGLRIPVTGTNQTFCPASVHADAANDFMSRNNYWCHPNRNAKPFFTFRNISVVGSDVARTSNPIAEVASSAVQGKPMIVPEYNWPWPNEFRAEVLPLMAAYGTYQDWDGLLLYNFRPEGGRLEMFGSQSDPVRWGAMPATAILYHRQDIAEGRKTVLLRYGEEDVFRGQPSHGRSPASPFRHVTYISKVRSAFLLDKSPAGADVLPASAGTPPPAEGRPLASDTGELVLDPGRDLFTAITPRTKAAVGFLGKAGPVDLGGAVLECRTPFAAVLVTSLDDQPIGESRRLLVTAVARAENTGQAFDVRRASVPQEGRPPVLAEPVDADLTVRLPGRPTVYALDETGRRRNEVAAQAKDGTLAVPLKIIRSPWCEIIAR